MKDTDKVTLTLGQLKRLVKESNLDESVGNLDSRRYTDEEFKNMLNSIRPKLYNFLNSSSRWRPSWRDIAKVEDFIITTLNIDKSRLTPDQHTDIYWCAKSNLGNFMRFTLGRKLPRRW